MSGHWYQLHSSILMTLNGLYPIVWYPLVSDLFSQGKMVKVKENVSPQYRWIRFIDCGFHSMKAWLGELLLPLDVMLAHRRYPPPPRLSAISPTDLRFLDYTQKRRTCLSLTSIATKRAKFGEMNWLDHGTTSKIRGKIRQFISQNFARFVTIDVSDR